MTTEAHCIMMKPCYNARSHTFKQAKHPAHPVQSSLQLRLGKATATPPPSRGITCNWNIRVAKIWKFHPYTTSIHRNWKRNVGL